MSVELYATHEARQRLREREDIAAIGSVLPREPMPIEHLFAELRRELYQPYRPFGCLPPMARHKIDTPK